MLDQKLLSILACPVCKGDLLYDKTKSELICLPDALAFPVRDGVPVMLTNDAREINLEERETY
ncbi:MAG: Trm112 family protein [Gammaproteobacteria bacterium]|jgi:hypothetical protein|nr:Trm112 family protein [Gammaproteobacteria bacterium]MBT3858782.1 Trm112 family protein [Gammaproteobacteria bacterium]MBT3986134.1 Trm112 family protein [Gammaproteobacteria bacterium]MBT4256448.1 Trm112 family protein [Gammaproteobacteria bacterium]MBT4581005.1 Trm112 family protein [Gammaproteobacteria bacterium]